MTYTLHPSHNWVGEGLDWDCADCLADPWYPIASQICPVAPDHIKKKYAPADDFNWDNIIPDLYR